MKTTTQLGDDSYFDLIIEAAGNETALSTAVAHALPGGKICVVSIFEDETSSSRRHQYHRRQTAFHHRMQRL